jgi:predicted TPR repeat methyltransferase
MSCLSRILRCFCFPLEFFGLYEPSIDLEEAREKLDEEYDLWKKYQHDRAQWWKEHQKVQSVNDPVHLLVTSAVQSWHNQKKVAVDLGCGITSTTTYLLKHGWTVYAVDSSKPVLGELKAKIKHDRLHFVHSSIEQYQYPEKVSLIIAIDSLPYTDPKKLETILSCAKQALIPGGLIVATLLVFDPDPILATRIRLARGGWMTTKKVVEAIFHSFRFTLFSIRQNNEPNEVGKQFYIVAQEGVPKRGG